MKKPTYTLSIPQPCNERWDAMTPSEKGRFCASCQKQVVDFSGLSDREVIQLIEQSSGKVCGRLRPQQLNRPMVFEPWVQRASVRFSGFFAGLMLLYSADTVSYPNVTTQMEAISEGNVSQVPFENDNWEAQKDTLKNTIYGRVIDAQTMKPIANAEIWIKQDSRIQTTSDSSGVFILKIPNERLGKVNRLTVQSKDYNLFELSVAGSNVVNGLRLSIPLEKVRYLIDMDDSMGRIRIEKKLD